MEKHFKHDPGLVVEPAFYSDGIPVFTPTMDQFRDFYKFNKAVNSYGMKSGIIKVIPPAEWLSKLLDVYTSESLEKVQIKNPIVQNVNSTAGFKGVYSSQNVERQRKYSLAQWLELSKKPNHQPPAPKKRRGSAEKEPATTNAEKANTRAKEHRQKRHRDRGGHLLDKEFNIDVSEFTKDRCTELELLYWRSLGYAEPMYGADVLGSLFQDSIKSWNVAHLPNILDLMDEKVPGVNDAYLYAGLWKATFSWHLEDQDLYSINYLHFGAPKQWYSISQKDSSRFYDLMKEIFNEDYKNCLEFLRHKTFLASPAFLEKNGIKCNKIVHNQGEFIITYPYGYHAGFNYGYNLAESVNFALDEWFEYAAKTKKCECIKDSVGINSRQIYCKFKGMPYDALVVSDDTKLPIEQKPIKRKRRITTRGQCALCPIELPGSLLKYREFELLACDGKRGLLLVHRICSEAFPLYLRSELKNGEETVLGIQDIPRSHRSLKCLYCRIPNKSLSNSGACFQCSAPTCSKSYHPICAISLGFLFNDQTCKVHRRSSSKFLERDDERYLDMVLLLTPDLLIQFSENSTGRRHTGEVRCGLIELNNSDSKTLSVVVFPALEKQMEVKYDDVLLGESTDMDNKRFLAMEVNEAVLAKGADSIEANGTEANGNAVEREVKSELSTRTSEKISRPKKPLSGKKRMKIAETKPITPPLEHNGPHLVPPSVGPNLGHNGFGMAYPHSQFMPALPPISSFGGHNYTFQHPRSFSDLLSWLLPLARQNGLVFINEYSGGVQSNPEMNHVQFVPEHF